ncbi:MAG: TadE/TadG family type IV pilus assembly protein, partial [Anaerolineae bacterium]|nr:TadE/TadG family type IV pilus assembly protein [Anaerolineae bacterium]
LLMLILLGCLDLGRAFATWLTLANRAREGARYGCDLSVPLTAADLQKVEARTLEGIADEGLSAQAVSVTVSTASVAGAGADTEILVKASTSLQLTTLMLFGGQPVTITAQARMVMLQGQGGA